MKNLLDPRGQWLGRPGRRRRLGQTGSAPVALGEALTVFRGQGPIVVPVLANDTDPEGGALTLVSAAAGLGTATANPDGTVTYAAPQGTPPGVVEFDTVTYEIADPDDNRAMAQIDVTITEPVLSVDPAPDNTLTVTAPPDPIGITITTPAVFAGTYQADPLDLLAGPVALAPPAIEGTATPGQTLTARAGLWIHDLAALPVTQGWHWQRAGADIPGATGAEYVMQAADADQGLTVTETLTDSYGARSALSAPVAFGFLPSDDAALLGWWDADDAATIAADGAGRVSAWADKAGGAALSQSNASRAPLTGQRLVNGRNAIDFDGNEFLDRPIALPASGDVAFHMALVIDGTSNAFEAVLAVEAANDFQLDAENAAQFDGRLNLAGVGPSVSLTGGPFSGALIVSVVFDRTGAAQAEVFVGGISRGATAYTLPLDTAAALHLMTNRSKNAWVDGAVAEVIVSGDVSNRADHHGYLAAKWGMV